MDVPTTYWVMIYNLYILKLSEFVFMLILCEFNLVF